MWDYGIRGLIVNEESSSMKEIYTTSNTSDFPFISI